MQYLYQASGRDGYEVVVDERAGLKYFKEFGVLRLGPGEFHEADTGDCEAMLHIIAGTCDCHAAGAEHRGLGSRETPFAGPPAALYLPPHTPFSVSARAGPVEATLTLAPAEPGGSAVAIHPEEVKPAEVGRDNWGRTVTMIAAPQFPSQRLILGETLNPSGNWSGVPAHKHDCYRPDLESVHEELYYFRVDRPGGWGIERVYDRDQLNQLLLLQDRAVTLKPRGYHTVAAAPGFGLYYSFVLSGPAKPLVPFLDPFQAWLVGGA